MARPISLDYDSIVREYESGVSLRAVAANLKISLRSVVRVIKLNGGGRPIAIANRLKFPGCDDKWKRVVELYCSGMSSERIAKVFSYNAAHIRKIVRVAGVSRTPREAAAFRPPRAPLATRRLTGDGYIRIQYGKHRWHEHRLIAEQMLSRPLRPGEDVHHKNGIRSDNRQANLEVLPSRSAHRKHHALNAKCLKCERRAKKRYLCEMHYQQIKHAGQLSAYPSMRRGPYKPHN